MIMRLLKLQALVFVFFLTLALPAAAQIEVEPDETNVIVNDELEDQREEVLEEREEVLEQREQLLEQRTENIEENQRYGETVAEDYNDDTETDRIPARADLSGVNGEDPDIAERVFPDPRPQDRDLSGDNLPELDLKE